MDDIKQISFYLYNGDERVVGLYGIMCQFTKSPKVYSDVDRIRTTVSKNLINRLEEMAKMKVGPSSEARALVSAGGGKVGDVPDFFKELDTMVCEDNRKALKGRQFDQLRVYTTTNELLNTYDIVRGEEIIIEERKDE